MRRLQGGLLLALGLAACGTSGEERNARVDGLVLFTVDTLRADALGSYGGTADTPRLDAFADESMLFEHAYAQACRTNPALTSLLTGLSPPHTAVFLQHHRMSARVTPLARLLQVGGVATGSFVANLCQLQDQERTVWSQGWDHIFCGMDVAPEQWQWDRAVVAAGEAWIAAQRGPWFAWIHLMDPHAEHRPPTEQWDYAARPVAAADDQWRRLGEFELRNAYPPREEIDELRELYAAEVRGVDQLFGGFLDFLAARGEPAASRTGVIFSADHGEELYETWAKHGHGFSLTEGVLHVPLILHLPGRGATRAEKVVETLQVTPTVLELFDLPAPYALDGASLLADEYSSSIAISYSGEIVSLRRGELRLWHHSKELPRYNEKIAEDLQRYAGFVPWFDETLLLARYDPAQPTQPVWLFPASPEFEERAQALRKRLNQHLRTFESLPPLEEIQDEGLRQQLEHLGYTAPGSD